MVKIAVAVDTIVTGQAVCAKVGEVFFGVNGIERAVTFGADPLVKRGNALGVAIVTGERNAGGARLMPGQGEAGGLVREVGRIHNGQPG